MRVRKLGIVLGLAACIMMAFAVVAAAEDKYPNGCADCHTKDLAFQPMIKKMYPKHPGVSPTMDINGCLKCHKSGGKLALNTKMHDSHAKAKIACDACHIMSGGKATAKLKGVK